MYDPDDKSPRGSMCLIPPSKAASPETVNVPETSTSEVIETGFTIAKPF